MNKKKLRQDCQDLYDEVLPLIQAVRLSYTAAKQKEQQAKSYLDSLDFEGLNFMYERLETQRVSEAEGEDDDEYSGYDFDY